ncbi:MAG: DUF4258 domain-containing protein [Ferruginibacter sp.]
MNKKYYPFIALLAAALLLYFVKKNQVSSNERKNIRIETDAFVTEGFDRNIRNIIYSKHARCRMGCRQIDESEVKEILMDGKLNADKIESSSKGVSYPLEGVTHDGQRVRIVFAPKEDTLIVVTVIDLDKEYTCDCD